MSGKFEIYEDDAGGFRWRLKAANGEVVAQSEGYTTKEDAKRGAFDAARASIRAQIVEVTDAKQS